VNTLAIDSTSDILSVALETKNGVLHDEIDKVNSHSELLMECADGLCKSAGIKPFDLNLVACMKGPGSFTGLRVGFSAAKGIALALGIPLIAVPTLDCLAYHRGTSSCGLGGKFPSSMKPGLVLPILDAKKGCFFAAFYRGGERLTDYFDESPSGLVKIMSKTMASIDESVLLTGSGARLFCSRIEEPPPENTNFIKNIIKNINLDSEFACGRARELLKMVKNDKFNMVNDIEGVPVYLRKSDAELNCKKDGENR